MISREFATDGVTSDLTKVKLHFDADDMEIVTDILGPAPEVSSTDLPPLLKSAQYLGRLLIVGGLATEGVGLEEAATLAAETPYTIAKTRGQVLGERNPGLLAACEDIHENRWGSDVFKRINVINFGVGTVALADQLEQFSRHREPFVLQSNEWLRERKHYVSAADVINRSSIHHHTVPVHIGAEITSSERIKEDERALDSIVISAHYEDGHFDSDELGYMARYKAEDGSLDLMYDNTRTELRVVRGVPYHHHRFARNPMIPATDLWLQNQARATAA